MHRTFSKEICSGITLEISLLGLQCSLPSADGLKCPRQVSSSGQNFSVKQIFLKGSTLGYLCSPRGLKANLERLGRGEEEAIDFHQSKGCVYDWNTPGEKETETQLIGKKYVHLPLKLSVRSQLLIAPPPHLNTSFRVLLILCSLTLITQTSFSICIPRSFKGT